MLDGTLPDLTEDEDLDDWLPVERAVQLELRRRGLDLELESLTDNAREFADLRLHDTELALAPVPDGPERQRAIATVVDELAEVLRDHATPFEEEDDDDE